MDSLVRISRASAIQMISHVQREEGTDSEAKNNLDTHADQCAVGLNVLVVNDFDRPVAAQGFDPKGPKIDNLHTVSAAMAYNLPDTGETVILLIHQAMHIPHLPHNLISPMQLWLNDVLVKDKPKFLTENLTAEIMRLLWQGTTLWINCSFHYPSMV